MIATLTFTHKLSILIAAVVCVVAMVALLAILARAVRSVGTRAKMLAESLPGQRIDQTSRRGEIPAAGSPFWLDETTIDWSFPNG